MDLTWSWCLCGRPLIVIPRISRSQRAGPPQSSMQLTGHVTPPDPSDETAAVRESTQAEPAHRLAVTSTAEDAMRSMVTAPHSVSLDGFIDNPRLHDWLRSGDTRSRMNPAFTMSAASAQFFDDGVSRAGAVIAGRRTYELSDAWGGRGPMRGLPLFVVTHHVPGSVPSGEPPYTFVTTGVEDAVEQARTAAAGKNVVLMGASLVRQCLHAGLLDELVISVVPVVLGHGVRLLDHPGPAAVELDLTGVVDAPGVTHLTYRILK